jgi:Homeodomain-like domain
MREERLGSGPSRFKDPRREAMLEPEEVSAIIRLNELGWGAKRISRELGISRNTVRDYIAAGGWTPYRQPRRKKALDGQASPGRRKGRRLCGAKTRAGGGCQARAEPGKARCRFHRWQIDGPEDQGWSCADRRGPAPAVARLSRRSRGQK